jgi:hypothetical protein
MEQMDGEARVNSAPYTGDQGRLLHRCQAHADD